MFKKISLLLTLGILIFAASCSKEIPVVNDASYYIKYASDGFASYNKYVVSYTDETGETVRLSDFRGDDFERTVGPVSKGFKAEYSITCTSSQYTNIAIGLRIEVKKDDGPFVVKKDAVKESIGFDCKASLTYTIE